MTLSLFSPSHYHQVLNEMDVTRAEIPQAGLTSLCPNVVDLDLANNLLESWHELIAILGDLPRVKYVNLSGNKLRLHSVCVTVMFLNVGIVQLTVTLLYGAVLGPGLARNLMPHHSLNGQSCTLYYTVP